jgi:hypothetical protein
MVVLWGYKRTACQGHQVIFSFSLVTSTQHERIRPRGDIHLTAFKDGLVLMPAAARIHH